ncbi:MAG: phosphoribosylglycinamide formyltransferase [Nocardia sp.]|uniref:phosphoribosylglycinamide formyltransferase n=1 Tax=Nocardia sp. TaxID=1821 RepID=UPI00262B4FC9|nr:phosphoribosylglycinamide formyltransferase [Nocardia sp.]MCU1644034.1 phosphoribosylglycinamide formyltransferase [Nocardia sp.]
MGKLRIGVLASHNGSNMVAVHEASLAPEAGFVVAVVISNNSSSGALAYAREHDIPTGHLSGRTHPDPADLDDAIRAVLVEHDVDWVVTAGYMRKLGPVVRKEFSGRIINIHPSLLPLHGGHGMYGMRVHEAVLAAGDSVSGPTLHLVDEEYDTGAVLAQREVPVLPEDTADTLAARVLAAEHVLLPQEIARIAAERHQRTSGE